MKYLLIVFSLVNFSGFSQSYIDYYFKSNEVNGAIVLFNDNNKEWVFNNESEAFTNSPAASHFHLWQTLVGLEEKVFSTSEKDIFKWDGVKRSFFGKRRLDWNNNMNLAEALKSQNDIFFDQLQYKLSDETYAKVITGNSFLKDIKDNKLPYFWNFSGLTNPNTMILFLKDLYENKLPFNIKSQNYLKSQLALDKSLILHTSETSYLGNKIIWTIGIYLKHSKPIYFSYRTQYSLEEDVLDNYEQRRNKVLSEIFQGLNI